MNPDYDRSIQVSTATLGEIELKYISLNDAIAIEESLSDDVSERRFVSRVIFQQIISPELDISTLERLPDIELIQIARALIEFESYMFRYFEDSGSFFEDFKTALEKDQEIQRDDILKIYQQTITSVGAQLSTFDHNFASVIQKGAETYTILEEATRQVSGLAANILDSQSQIIASLKPTIDYLSLTADVVTNALSPQIELWQGWVDQNRVIFDGYSGYWEDLHHQYEINKAEAARILRKYKWFITPSLPALFVAKVVRVGQRPGRQDKSINRLFFEHFEENNWKNLEALVRGWHSNPLLRKRYHILSDCVESVKLTSKMGLNCSNAILPTLITQIDGAISDYLILNGINWDTEYDDLIDRNTGKVRKVGRKTQISKTRPRLFAGPLDDLANDIFLNILFQASQKGKPLKTPFNFNRHKIIHGNTVRYGRKDYLVRAFMILDLLAHFVKSD